MASDAQWPLLFYEEDDIYHYRSFSLPFTLVGLYHNQFCTNEEINKSIDKYLLCNVNLPFPLFVLNILQYTDAAHSRSLKRSAAHSTRCLWQAEPQRRLAGFLLRRKPLLQQTSHSPGYRGFNFIWNNLLLIFTFLSAVESLLSFASSVPSSATPSPWLLTLSPGTTSSPLLSSSSFCSSCCPLSSLILCFSCIRALCCSCCSCSAACLSFKSKKDFIFLCVSFGTTETVTHDYARCMILCE